MAGVQAAVQSLTIPISSFVSDVFAVTGAKLFAVWVPTITSGQLLLRGSYDTTSANFVPILNPNATPIASRWWADVGPGSCAIVLDWVGQAFPFMKLETSVAQAAARSPIIITKLA
jgi:hypothetical protein